MDKISYKLEVFEGPMDLLLHLISKHKLNIYDIPIFELVEQYTIYVRQMQESNLDVASEFLEMAARLVYIKTVSLLPKHEEADTLKSELTGELLEYRDCQIMAQKLNDNANGFDYLVKKPEVVEKNMDYSRCHQPDEILAAFISAIGKGCRKLPPSVDVFKGIVAKKIVSVNSKIKVILHTLKNFKSSNINSFYQNAESKSDIVATFLAVLELLKDKTVTVKGERDNVFIELSKGAEVVEREQIASGD